jgi:hypothetical protein
MASTGPGVQKTFGGVKTHPAHLFSVVRDVVMSWWFAV